MIVAPTRSPTAGIAWRMAAWFTSITLAVNVALFGLIFASSPMEDIIPHTLGADDGLMIGIICAVAALVILLASRMGAKSAQKRAAKAALTL